MAKVRSVPPPQLKEQTQMPFQEHQEFATLFSELPKSICAACVLKNADIKDRDIPIEVFEHTAIRAKRFAQGMCTVCKANTFVINPT
jgi:hypothetical protein